MTTILEFTRLKLNTLNKIIINGDNSINQSAPFFHQKDGFPMKLSIESFLLY
jgi:hypothetical protein